MHIKSKLLLFQGPWSPAVRRIGTWARIHRIDEPSTEDPEIANSLDASQSDASCGAGPAGHVSQKVENRG